MGRTMKADVVFYTASVCALLIIAGFCGWSWWKAACEDAASNPKSVAERFMHIKSQSMVDIRDGLASRDYRRTEMALGCLRRLARTQNGICPKHNTARQATSSAKRWINSVEMYEAAI